MVEGGNWDGEPDGQHVLTTLEIAQQSRRDCYSVCQQDEAERGADEELPWPEEAPLFTLLSCE